MSARRTASRAAQPVDLDVVTDERLGDLDGEVGGGLEHVADGEARGGGVGRAPDGGQRRGRLPGPLGPLGGGPGLGPLEPGGLLGGGLAAARGEPGLAALEPLRGDACAGRPADGRQLPGEGRRAQLVGAEQEHGRAPGVSG